MKNNFNIHRLKTNNYWDDIDHLNNKNVIIHYFDESLYHKKYEICRHIDILKHVGILLKFCNVEK